MHRRDLQLGEHGPCCRKPDVQTRGEKTPKSNLGANHRVRAVREFGQNPATRWAVGLVHDGDKLMLCQILQLVLQVGERLDLIKRVLGMPCRRGKVDGVVGRIFAYKAR